MNRVSCFAILIASVAAGGCAGNAKRPDSPAAHISAKALSEQTPAPPGERYFLLTFSSYPTPKQFRYTHTWATVVKVTDGPTPAVEHHTISWLPATLDIHPLRFRTEPGVALGLAETLAVVTSHQEQVNVWGPYEVRHGYYQKFLVQKAFIESGAIRYQCNDSVGEAARTGDGSNCTHAVTDMDSKFGRERYPTLKTRWLAGGYIAEECIKRGVVADPAADNDWVLPLVGLDKYPLIRRSAEPH